MEIDLENKDSKIVEFDPCLYEKAKKVANFMNKSVFEFIKWCVDMKLNDIQQDPINFISYQLGPDKLLDLIFK